MADLAEPIVARLPVDPMQPKLMRVEKIRQETSDTFTLEMADPGGSQFVFQPGQFNMIGIIGIGEVPISISGDPDRPEMLVHTTRVVGVVTSALRQVHVGDFVSVRGPYGRPWPMDLAEGRDVILINGGIGLAPVRPVIYKIVNHRRRYGKFAVLYGTRTPEDILFEKELARWRSHFDVELELTLDRGEGEWQGNVGVVTRLISRLALDPANTIALICGPEIMMRFTVQALSSQGLSPELTYVSMERNMKCGIGLCGHCQVRGDFVCRSGPVYKYSEIAPWLTVREL